MGQQRSKLSTDRSSPDVWEPNPDVFMPDSVKAVGGDFSLTHTTSGDSNRDKLPIMILGDKDVVERLLAASDFPAAFVGSDMDDYMVNAKWRVFQVGNMSPLHVEQHAPDMSIEAFHQHYFQRAAGICLCMSGYGGANVAKMQELIHSIKEARKEQPDVPIVLVVLDLPRGSETELLENLREFAVRCNVPVLMFGAHEGTVRVDGKYNVHLEVLARLVAMTMLKH